LDRTVETPLTFQGAAEIGSCAREGHLTSVFRKLRLDSRTELIAALAEDIPVSAWRPE
jgi:hypothetical protein